MGKVKTDILAWINDAEKEADKDQCLNLLGHMELVDDTDLNIGYDHDLLTVEVYICTLHHFTNAINGSKSDPKHAYKVYHISKRNPHH